MIFIVVKHPVRPEHDHFKAAIARMPDLLADVPEIVHVEVPGDGWARMAEFQPRVEH